MKLSSNIWKLYLYRIFSCMLFVIPVFVLFLMENGLSLTQIMILQAYYAIITLLLEIPTGAFADIYGRKKAIVYSTLFMIIGSAFYSFGYSFTIFLIAETAWAIATSLWSGTDSAFIYDTLKSLNREKEYNKVYGNFNALNLVFWGLASVAGGFIAAYSLRLTYQLTLIPLVIAVFITLTFTEPKFHKPVQLTYWNHIKEAVQLALSHKQIKYLILYSTIFAGISQIVYKLYQPYMQSTGIELQYFGVIFFGISLAGALGSRISHRIDTLLGDRLTLSAFMIFNTTGLIILGWLVSLPLIIVLLALSFIGGILTPTISAYINHHIKSYQRATILSLANLSTHLFFAALAPAMGYVANIYSINQAFFLSGIILSINLLIIFLLYRK